MRLRFLRCPRVSGNTATMDKVVRRISLCTGNFDAKFFGKPLPDLLWQPVMDAPRALFGCIENRHRRRSGHSHAQPDQSRKTESREGCDFQPEGMARAEVPDHAKGKQEDACGNRGQRYQPHIDNTMNLLSAAAVFTTGEMAFVVAAHF